MRLAHSRTSAAITRTTTALILVVIIVVAAGGYYYYSGIGRTKGTIVVGTTDSEGDCSCLDPARVYDYFGGSVMVTNLGAPLVDFAPGTTDTSPSALQPALATKWSESSNGLTYTFILRSGVKFDDGTPFNSTAVKYSVDRGISIASSDGPFVGVGIGDIIASVTTPNATAVVFNLKAPFSAFLSMLTFSAMYPVNPHRAPVSGIVNFTAGNPTASNPMGLGPYNLTEWARSGNTEVEMKLDANPNYWNYPAYPKTPHIVIKFYADATALAAAVQAGDIDMAYRQFKSADIKSMQSTAGLKVYPSPGAFIQYLVLNEHIAPFDNPIVRKAIAAATNRTDLVNTVFLGTSSALYAQIPLGMFGHQDAFKTTFGADANYTLANQFLSQAGYTSTNKLTIDLWYESSGHYPQSSDQALVLKASLEKSCCINVQLHGTDWTTYSTQRHAGTMPVFIMGWYPDFIDPFDYTQPFFQSTGSSWLHYGYNSSQMDSLIQQAQTATSQSQAGIVYGQILTLSAADVPIIPLYQGGANCCGVVAKTSVSGIYLDVTLLFRYYTLVET